MKIIVTGAAKGMGAHFTRRLAEAGATVAAGDIDTEGLSELTSSCSEMPGTVITQALDVGSDESIASFVEFAKREAGGLNGVISNAGVLADGLLVKRSRKTGKVEKMSREAWQRVIDINLTGATMVIRDAVAAMIESESPGVVISMSSLARHGNRGQSNYVAAKASLAANTVTWAREFGRYGIRVGAIAPGMIETPMTRGMNQKARDALVSNVPVGRVGAPEDIWLGVKFIIECEYFTGRTLDIDGGLVM